MVVSTSNPPSLILFDLLSFESSTPFPLSHPITALHYSPMTPPILLAATSDSSLNIFELILTDTTTNLSLMSFHSDLPAPVSCITNTLKID